MKYKGGGGLQMPHLNFVQWFHPKNISVEYPIMVYLLPKLFFPPSVEQLAREVCKGFKTYMHQMQFWLKSCTEKLFSPNQISIQHFALLLRT